MLADIRDPCSSSPAEHKECNAPVNIIGVPKEIKAGAERVGLTPFGVKDLVKQGIKVIVEKGAGRRHFSDRAYEKSRGAVRFS